MKEFWKKPCHVPRPQKVCFCLPLRKGLIAFAYLNLIVFLAAYSAFVFLDEIKAIISLFSSQARTYKHMFRTRLSILTYLIIYIGGAVAELVMTVLILVGLHKQRSKLVSAYEFYATINTILIGITRTLDVHVLIWEYDVSITVAFLCFKVYHILMVRSQVKNMQMKEKQDAEVELVTVKDVEVFEVKILERNADMTDDREISIKYQGLDDTVKLIPADNNKNMIEINS